MSELTVVCDPGIDDMLALMLMTGAGLVPAQVVATAGNAPLPVTVANSAAICAMLGLPLSVVAGCDCALAGPYPCWGTKFHGEDGLGGVARRLTAEHLLAPAEATRPFFPAVLGGRVIATSALTPVALALRAGFTPLVTWMGGAHEADGNITAVAEFNGWLDPEAADETLRSGCCEAMVPLDVTEKVAWTRAELAELATVGRLAEVAVSACGWLHRFGPVRLPDVVAAVAFLRPEVFGWQQLLVRCDTGNGLTRGMTTCIPGRGRQVNVAVEVDARAVKDMLATSLAALG
jgi:purine nucleosidase